LVLVFFDGQTMRVTDHLISVDFKRIALVFSSLEQP
jgi:hypothetical protein